jgi:hypothetical protein
MPHVETEYTFGAYGGARNDRNHTGKWGAFEFEAGLIYASLSGVINDEKVGGTALTLPMNVKYYPYLSSQFQPYISFVSGLDLVMMEMPVANILTDPSNYLKGFTSIYIGSALGLLFMATDAIGVSFEYSLRRRYTYDVKTFAAAGSTTLWQPDNLYAVLSMGVSYRGI